jgi:flagellar biosynthesis protein FlhF
VKIKTFYCKTMAEALREIKAELGPDALLLSTKEIPSRSGAGRSSSGFEVVAASDCTDNIDLAEISPSMETAAIEENAPLKHRALEPSEISGPLTYSRASLKIRVPAPRKQTLKASKPRGARLADHSAEKAVQGANLPFSGTVALGLYRDLIARGVHDWLASKLLVAALKNLPPKLKRSRTSLLHAVANAVQELLPSPSAPNGLPGKKLVAFVGPTGVGKTTSIAKLAARLALREKKKVVLISLDGFRIGAIEQLKTYARLIGIPFRFVSEISDLDKAIKENTQRDYILIDTAGRGPRDLAAIQDLAEFLQNSSEMERHLVLSATTKPSDIHEIVDRFEVCRPDHLLFTKLDETSTPGPILNEVIRTQKSFSYYTNGQRVPEDLHAVVSDRIIEIVLNAN